MRPPEPFAETHARLGIAGVGLAIAVWVLAGTIGATRGEKDGKADSCGKRISVRELAQRYRHSYSPGRPFRNPLNTHIGEQAPHSPVYRIVWTFLTVWLAMTGFYLFWAAVFPQIELFRADELSLATLLNAIALLLCAAWIPLVRLGSYTRAEEEAYRQRIVEKREKYDGECTTSSWDLVPRPGNKNCSLPLALLVLVLAWGLSLNACVRTQAWTLPFEDQIGTFLFVAPGFSLFAGWLAVAVMLCLGLVISYYSSPDGNQAWPIPKTKDELKNLYPPSLLPIFFAIVLAIIASLIPDPALPVPLWATLLVFAPYVTENLSAAGIALIGTAIAVMRVLSLRESE